MSSLASPAFGDDDGSVDPAVHEAVAGYARTGRLGGVLEALGRSRLLVPVLAHESEMAAVLMTGADGRTALLAFFGLASMREWDPNARPVPVTTADAARAARAEGASAIVVDVAGPTRVVLETEDLDHFAAGEALVRTDAGFVWTDLR